MVTEEELKGIALYTIDTANNEQFEEDLDATQLNDTVIVSYVKDIVNKAYDNKRELEFNCVKQGDDSFLNKEHPIASKIISIIENQSEFKTKTYDIANHLFSHTTGNAKKGDLVSCLFKKVDCYYFVMLKIDENKILKRNKEGLWEIDAGLGVETKLQKAAYIEIPIVDDGCATDYLLWKVKALDNISNDSEYWNIKFLDAHYKSDAKINSERFNNFFKKFASTVSDPQKKSDIMYSYRSYLRVNNNFEIENFCEVIFGTSNDLAPEKKRFKEAVVAQSSHQSEGFDLVFGLDRKIADKESKVSGCFVFDSRLKVMATKATSDSNNDKNILNDLVHFEEIDANGDSVQLEDDSGTYAKIYFQEFEYNDK